MTTFFERLPLDAIDEFPLFGRSYFVALFVSLIILYLSYRYLPKLREKSYEPFVRYGIIIYLLGTVVYKQWFYFSWDLPWYAHLPDATCGVAILTGILTLITKNRTMFVITLFLGWGAFLALFAPNLLEGPNRYYFYQFYLRHILIIISSIYMMRVFDFTLLQSDYIVYVIVLFPLSLLGWGFSALINDVEYLNMFYMLQPAVSNPILDGIYSIHPLLYTIFWIGVAFLFGYLYGLPFYQRQREKE